MVRNYGINEFNAKDYIVGRMKGEVPTLNNGKTPYGHYYIQNEVIKHCSYCDKKKKIYKIEVFMSDKGDGKIFRLVCKSCSVAQKI